MYVTERNIDSFERSYVKDGVTIKFDFYSYNKLHCGPLAVVELSVCHENFKLIEIQPSDLLLKFQGRPLEAQAIDWKTAQRYFFQRGVTTYQWLGISGSPLRPVSTMLLLPILIGFGLLNFPGLLQAINDYIAWRRKTKLLWRNSFAYGHIFPSQTRRGFVYLAINEREAPNVRLDHSTIDSSEIDVAVHPRSGKTAYHSETRGTYRKRQPFLPGLADTSPILMYQVATFAIIGCLAATLLKAPFYLGALSCGGIYLVVGAVVLYALSRDSL